MFLVIRTPPLIAVDRQRQQIQVHRRIGYEGRPDTIAAQTVHAARVGLHGQQSGERTGGCRHGRAKSRKRQVRLANVLAGDHRLGGSQHDMVTAFTAMAHGEVRPPVQQIDPSGGRPSSGDGQRTPAAPGKNSGAIRLRRPSRASHGGVVLVVGRGAE